MIYISEWLPNPQGNDKGKEWIELANSGRETMDLNGWKVKNGKEANFYLTGDIGPGEYKLIAPKFTIRNANESVFLYGKDGKLEDSSSFRGSAEEGKSLVRISYKDHVSRWGSQTPGNKNVVPQDSLVGLIPSPGVLRGGGMGWPEIMALLLITSVSVALLALYALKKENALSKLFFPGD